MCCYHGIVQDGETVMNCAAGESHIDIIEWLVEAGLDPLRRNPRNVGGDEL